MKNYAILALVALLPIAAAAGFLSNPDPPSPQPLTLEQAINQTLNPDGPQAQEQWLYVVTSGVLRGQESDAVVVAQLPPKDLKDYPGRYVVRTCSFFSTSGRPKELFDAEMVGYCTQRLVTKRAVLAHARATT